MSKRFNDIPYNTFSLWTNIAVVCPKCNKVGTVYFDNQHNTATFQCQSCFMERKTMLSKNEVNAQRTSTGKYFRILISKDKMQGQKVKVK